MTAVLYTREEAIRLGAEYYRHPIKDKSYQQMSRLGAAVAEYLARKRLSGAAEATLVTTESDLARLARDVPADTDVATVTVEQLMLVLEQVPAASRRRAVAHWNGLLEWAILSQKRTTPNPVKMLPRIKRVPARVYDIFSGPELAAIVDAARADPYLPWVNYVRALLLTETGMRAGGALRLRVRDVNLYERRVLLREKGDKERLVPIRGEVVQAFDRFLLEPYPLLDRQPAPDDFLWFPVTAHCQRLTSLHPERPVHYSTFWNWWKATCERAGVRYRKAHMTRHTYATNVLDATDGNRYAAQQLLGHVSPATTDIYLHSSTLHMERAVDKLEAFRNLQRD